MDTCEHTWQEMVITLDDRTVEVAICTKCKSGRTADGAITQGDLYFWSKKVTVDFK